MSDHPPDPAADVSLQEQLLKAASRHANPRRADKVVASTDKGRVIKAIVSGFDLGYGSYDPKAPSDDELVNLCLATPAMRGGHWMLFMARSRASLNLAKLIARPTSEGGVPTRQIQTIENDLNGPARDIYRGFGIIPENVGLVVRLGGDGLFVYGGIDLTPLGAGSVCFPLGDPHDKSSWRTIFPFSALVERNLSP